MMASLTSRSQARRERGPRLWDELLGTQMRLPVVLTPRGVQLCVHAGEAFMHEAYDHRPLTHGGGAALGRS